MSERVVIPAGTQLDSEHVALKDIQFEVERIGDIYSAKWADQGAFGAIYQALSAGDAVWLTKKGLCSLLDWIDSGDEDAVRAECEYGEVLRESIAHHKGARSDRVTNGVTLEGHLLEAGDGFEWSSLFISGLSLAEALAAAFRVEKMEDSYIQLWGYDDDGNDIDPDATICCVVDEEEQPTRHERLFYDFGRVRITVERLGGEG